MSTDAAELGELLPSEQWPHTEDEDTEPCPDCGTRRPVGQACLVCRDAQQASLDLDHLERSAAKRTQVCTELVERMVELAKNDGSAAAIVPIAEGTIDDLGGVKAISAIWANVIRQATDGKHIMAGLKAMSDFAHVLIAIAPKIERRTDFREISDEELEEEFRSTAMREAMLRLIHEEPEVAPYVERFLARCKGFDPGELPDGDERAATEGDD